MARKDEKVEPKDQAESGEFVSSYFSDIAKEAKEDPELQNVYISADPGSKEYEAQQREAREAKKIRKSPRAPLKKGAVAHYHERETVDYDIVKEPCIAVDYRVKTLSGLRVNEVLYRGTVVVPTCLANYLTQMDQEAHKNERAIYSNQGRKVELGEVIG